MALGRVMLMARTFTAARAHLALAATAHPGVEDLRFQRVYAEALDRQWRINVDGVVAAVRAAVEQAKIDAKRVSYGTIEIDSEPKAARASVPPMRRRRVLVIDDEEAVARAVARVLHAQHDVETCADGRAALVRLLGRDTYDAVLCDLMMPAMGGSEVYDAVLAARPALAARFAFLTGGVTTEAAAAFLERAGRPVGAQGHPRAARPSVSSARAPPLAAATTTTTP